MTTNAVDVILSKAWELNFQAFIFVNGQPKFYIYPDKWDWKAYNDLGIICLFSKENEIEYYIDTKEIVEIHVFSGNQEKGK